MNLEDIGFLCVLTKEVIDECYLFTCGDDPDMDEFFCKDALDYTKFRMGKSYCFRLIDNPKEIIACFTVSNDSIRLFDLGSSKKNKMWKEISNREKRLSRYPGVLIGRLAVASKYANKGIGTDVIRFIKEWFVDEDNRSVCRLAIVDAKNKPNVLQFYQKKCHFKFLFKSEEDEFRYKHLHEDKCCDKQAIRLNTRLMYCDLLAED